MIAAEADSDEKVHAAVLEVESRRVTLRGEAEPSAILRHL